jgi:nicotinate dehydrogenase subunit A
MTTLTVNGEQYRLDCPDDEPLVYALRNRLGLTGTKLACGLEQCGACVVLVDGECRYACTLPVAACANRAVTTVEGLGREDALHAVQQALLEHNAAQCGYCLSGLLVRSAWLFAADRHPAPETIRQALAPHVCRCGAQPRVLRALESLAAEG